MKPRLSFALFAGCSLAAAAITAGGLAACTSSATPTVSPTPIASQSPSPDTLYVQDTTSRTVRVYKNASTINGVAAVAFSPLPTSDGAQPDVVYGPAADVLWYPNQTTNQIDVWTTASMDGGKGPNFMVPASPLEGAEAFDSNHHFLYIAFNNSNVINVYHNAETLGQAGNTTPVAQITLAFLPNPDSNPHPQEMYYDAINDRLFVADNQTIVAKFDAFGAGAGVTHTATANSQIGGLFSPNGLAYSAPNDVLFVGEPSSHQVDCIAGASTKNGTDNHGRVISDFQNGPTGLAYDAARDLLFIYDPNSSNGSIQIVPNAASSASGNVNSIVNHHVLFDAGQGSLSGFGLFVDTTH